MWSFDFVEIEALQHAGRLAGRARALMIEAARRLERGGADFIADLHQHHAPHGR